MAAFLERIIDIDCSKKEMAIKNFGKKIRKIISEI